MTKCSRSKFPGAELVHMGGLTIWVSTPRDRVAEQRFVAQLQRELQNRPQRKSTQEKKKDVRRAAAKNAPATSSNKVPLRTIAASPLRLRQFTGDPRVLNAPTGPRQLASTNQVPGFAPTGPRVRDSRVKSEPSSQSMSLSAVPSNSTTHSSRASGLSENSNDSNQPGEMSILDRLEILLHPKAQLPPSQNFPAEDESKNVLAPTEQPSATSLFPFPNLHGHKEQALNQIEEKPISASPNQRSDATEPGELKENPHRPSNHSHPKLFLSTPPGSRSTSSHGSDEDTIPELRRQAAFWHNAWEKQNKEVEHLRELRVLKDRELAALSELLATAQEKNGVLEKRNLAALNALGFQM